MARILVLYYSSYGHVEQLAHAAAEGVGQVEGAEALVRRVPEVVPVDIARDAGYKLEQPAPVATVDELADYDGVIFGTPTRFGNMASQMKQFLDQAGGLWAQGKLVGKVGSVFTSTATQHGGQESTLLSFHNVLLHLGFVIVGLPYSFPGQMGVEEIHGGTPYGASTIAGPDGSLQPKAVDLEAARFQGRHVADIPRRLTAG